MPPHHSFEHPLAHIVVVLTALYLIALGIAALITPQRVQRFLSGFASTPGIHFTELIMRLLVGAAFIANAPLMQFSRAFSVFGWVLVVTSACLLAIPWRFHRRFAETAVTRAMRYCRPMGIVSLALGILVMVSTIHGV